MGIRRMPLSRELCGAPLLRVTSPLRPMNPDPDICSISFFNKAGFERLFDSGNTQQKKLDPLGYGENQDDDADDDQNNHDSQPEEGYPCKG
jgi:hypothetical protein